MDAYEATRVVFSRIQALDPDSAAKIMGLLLIQDHGEKEMIRLAFGPEALLHSVILKARKELGLLSPSTPLSLLSRQNSSSRSGLNSPSSWAPNLQLSRSNISDDGCGGVVDDEFLLQEQQLSFLNEQAADPGGYWDQGGFGWKPCLYFARGFCKNGSSCRFVHGPADDMPAAAAAAAVVEQHCQELMLMRSKSQRLAASAAAAAAAFPYSPTGSSSCKNLNFMFQQQQNESQRAAAAALMLENDNHKFMGRPRMERDFIGMMNPVARQIYLTFPADSTFREEDVSNYFSIYGPVQDVRIPYQQKRMFGFVTFVYPETVKLILAKGNPHFVCDARVLVKPYKEKGKIPDKYRKPQGERYDFSGCTTPTGLDSRDPFDLQQLVSPRMMYGGNNHEVLLRRKMEEQQAAADLQQAIEMQGRRFLGLQLLDIKNRSWASPPPPILSPLATPNSTAFNNNAIFSDAGSSSNGSQDEDKSLSPAASGIAALSAAAVATAASKQQTAVNSGESEVTSNEDISYQESFVFSAEHNLPDSPFASPTKSSLVSDSCPLANDESSFVTSNGSSNGHLTASSLLPASSPLVGSLLIMEQSVCEKWGAWPEIKGGDGSCMG